MSAQSTGTDHGSYNVCLMGASLGTNNMGVSALAASLVKLIHGIRPNAAFHLLIGERSSESNVLTVNNTQVTVHVVNFRMSLRSKLHQHLVWIFVLACIYRLLPLKGIRGRIAASNPWIRTLLEADFVGDIRGGDSFSDIYGLNRLLVGVVPVIIALILKKNVVMLPQTYGPFKSSPARSVARWILRRANNIISRDRASIETVREMLGTNCKADEIRFCPDVAFALDAIVPENPKISPQLNGDSGGPLIGINVNGLMYSGGYSRKNMFGLKMDYPRFIVELINRLMAETAAHVLLVPHTFGLPDNVNSDPAASVDVLNKIDPQFKDRVHLVTEQYDQNNIKGIIGLCEFFIGSRMHSCIAAISQGIPTVGVAYSKKFIGVFKSADLDDMVVDARSLDTEAAIDEVMSCFEKRGQHVVTLRERITSLKSDISRVFNDLIVS